MPDKASGARAPAQQQAVAAADETPYQQLDRLVQTAAASRVGHLSPVTLGLAWADWAWHLAASPGRQMELAVRAAQLTLDTLELAAEPGGRTGERDPDSRFRDPLWEQWPFSLWRRAFGNTEAFWREATQVPGMSTHNAQLVAFFARQWLDMLTPSNRLATNPVVLERTVQTGGGNLLDGLRNLIADASGVPTPEDIAGRDRFVVGGNLATTPGKVVYRNRLVELIRYAPQTTKVYPEPVFMLPSWIMKYYILDLSAHNSLVRYMVSQGHTVYMVSWRNPDESDSNLSMDDYLELGVLEAMRAARSDAGGAELHAMGYCLGGTLLAIAVAGLSRAGGIAGYNDIPAPLSFSLLAGQVDFSEPGELGLFIDEGQINLLDHVMRGQGFLSGNQMAGSFQFLRSRDLVWTRRMHEYLLGEREQGNDLMAWNADTTRLPARMHHQYLYALYLKNALANGRYEVGDNPVLMADIQMPVFLVGTERDHVSPWRSVYKLHMLARTEITFVLASGGHNAGIVSEPGHPRRHYRIGMRPAHGTWVPPDTWFDQAHPTEGSWWPAWHAWLAERSSAQVKARPIPPGRALADAPGSYVMQHYPDP